MGPKNAECRFLEMAFEGSARPGVALFDRASSAESTQQSRHHVQERCAHVPTARAMSGMTSRVASARDAAVPASPACVVRAISCGRADPRRRRRRGDRWRRSSRGVSGVCSVSMPRTPLAILDVAGPLSRVSTRADARLRCARTRGFQKRRLDRAPGYRRRVHIPAAATTPRREAGRASRRDPPGGAPRASRRASRPPRRPHRSRGFLGFFPVGRSLFSGRTRFFPLPQALEARSHPRRPTSSPSSHAQQVVAPTPAPSTRCPSRAPWAR